MKYIGALLSLIILTTVGIGNMVSAQSENELSGTQWQLIALDDQMLPPDMVITLSFADETFNGASVCNTYFGDYTVAGHDLKFGAIASTEMACLDPTLQSIETEYLGALGLATRYEIVDEQLIITYDDAERQMIFGPAANLANTQWELQSLAGMPIVSDTPPTIEFGDGSQANGNTGCNLWSTHYTVDGATLIFSMDIITTRRACLGDASTEQELAYLEALRSVSSYKLDGDLLTLFYGEGAELVFARQTQLVDITWQLESINDAGVVGDTPLTLIFSQDGTVSGNSGCNSFSGIYLISGTDINIGELISTLRACLDEDVMAQESAYLDVLMNITQYTVNVDTLTLTTGGFQQLVFKAVPMATISVAVDYPAGVELPMDAEITVQLQDTSLADASAVVITTEIRLVGTEQAPFVFDLRYDPTLIDPRNTYTIRADIRLDGVLLLTTDTAYPVITNDANTASIQLVTVN